MIMTNAMKAALDDAYNRGRQAGKMEAAHKAYLRGKEVGMKEQALEDFQDEKRRNEQLYAWAYEQGAMDALAKHGIIEIDDIEGESEENG